MNEDELDKRAQRDQDLATIRDSLPAMWWSLYQGCIDAGFTETDAMKLVRTFISRRDEP